MKDGEGGEDGEREGGREDVPSGLIKEENRGGGKSRTYNRHPSLLPVAEPLDCQPACEDAADSEVEGGREGGRES
jgi:hypothetical protein